MATPKSKHSKKRKRPCDDSIIIGAERKRTISFNNFEKTKMECKTNTSCKKSNSSTASKLDRKVKTTVDFPKKIEQLSANWQRMKTTVKILPSLSRQIQPLVSFGVHIIVKELEFM